MDGHLSTAKTTLAWRRMVKHSGSGSSSNCSSSRGSSGSTSSNCTSSSRIHACQVLALYNWRPTQHAVNVQHLVPAYTDNTSFVNNTS